jgi:bifunctional non-homologous end joining protein LigD
MHAVPYPRPFTADGWVFENKLDGFRALMRKTDTSVELLSRSGRSFGEQFPDVMNALARLPDCVIDAELVVLDSAGNPIWERLRRRAAMRQKRSVSLAAMQEPALLCAFDLLSLEGRDLRRLSLVKRKAALHALLPDDSRLLYVNDLATHGEALYATAVQLGQEGIIAKRAESPYKAGRQPTWRKIKNPSFYRQDALGWRA